MIVEKKKVVCNSFFDPVIGKSKFKKSVVYEGDCLQVLKKKCRKNSVDLIVTSPPYADQRRKTYGGIHPNEYVDWFMERADEFFRVLKQNGSFILNIKEKAVNGERHTYVLELILEMKKNGWYWIEEYIWHKKNSFPGKWTNRFRNSWERLLHFTKDKKFKMFQDNVKIPIGDWSKQRLKKLSKNDFIRHESQVGSGFGKNVANWLDKGDVYPTNVLHMSTECNNKNHSAVFPLALPIWFIKLFTQENDVVLDPFAGSGTTLLAAQKLGRRCIGIDVSQEYVGLMIERLRNE